MAKIERHKKSTEKVAENTLLNRSLRSKKQTTGQISTLKMIEINNGTKMP